jgi:hypothetical protein
MKQTKESAKTKKAKLEGVGVKNTETKTKQGSRAKELRKVYKLPRATFYDADPNLMV